MPANKERSAARTAATRELVRSWAHPKRTTAEVAKLCGVSVSTAAQHLAALRKAGTWARMWWGRSSRCWTA